jgi:3-oxoadipate enol-lactonase
MPDLVLTATPLAGSAANADLLVVGPSLGTSVTELWSDCARLLGDGFAVLGWDLPGHGRSPAASNGFSVADLADAVTQLTEDLRREHRSCWYAGVSLGGVVGLELALRNGPFEAVAAIAAAAKVGDPTGWQERASVVRRAGTPVMVEPSSQRWFGPGFIDRHARVAGALLSALADTDRESYASACEALARFDIRERLEDLTVPLLLIPGSEDVVVTVAQARDTADSAPGAKVHVLQGCGHLPPAEDPAGLAAVLTGFFAHDTTTESDNR